MLIERPPKDEWIGYVPLRRWFRLPIRWLFICMTVFGVALALLGILHLKQVIYLDTDPSMLLLVGVLAAVGGPVLWSLLAAAELVVVKSGMYFGTQFIPWAALGDIRTEEGDLVIDTPSHRGFWNYWRGNVRLSKHLFDLPEDLVDCVWSQAREMR
jgi:hypothetical protein